MSYDEKVHLIPLISPVDIVATDVTTDEVDVGECQWFQFVIPFGTITNDTCTVTVEKCTDTSGTSNTAIAFNYRLSAAVGTDTMGAITAATTSGVAIGASDDDKILIIDIDPAAVASGGPYVRAVLTTGGGMSACEVAVIGLAWPRYPQNVSMSMIN